MLTMLRHFHLYTSVEFGTTKIFYCVFMYFSSSFCGEKIQSFLERTSRTQVFSRATFLRGHLSAKTRRTSAIKCRTWCSTSTANDTNKDANRKEIFLIPFPVNGCFRKCLFYRHPGNSWSECVWTAETVCRLVCRFLCLSSHCVSVANVFWEVMFFRFCCFLLHLSHYLVIHVSVMRHVNFLKINLTPRDRLHQRVLHMTMR